MPILKDSFDHVKDALGDVGSDIEDADEDVIGDFKNVFTGRAVTDVENILQDAGMTANFIETVVEQLSSLASATESTIVEILTTTADTLGIDLTATTAEELGAAIFGALFLL